MLLYELQAPQISYEIHYVLGTDIQASSRRHKGLVQIFAFSYLVLLNRHIPTTKHTQHDWISLRYYEAFDRLVVLCGNSDALESVGDIR